MTRIPTWAWLVLMLPCACTSYSSEPVTEAPLTEAYVYGGSAGPYYYGEAYPYWEERRIFVAPRHPPPPSPPTASPPSAARPAPHQPPPAEQQAMRPPEHPAPPVQSFRFGPGNGAIMVPRSNAVPGEPANRPAVSGSVPVPHATPAQPSQQTAQQPNK